jgi:hypothetical protein
MLTDQPDRPGLGVLIEPLVWHRAIFLPSMGSAHETRVGSGPWAEAYADWGARPPDGVDAIGHTFADYLRTSMETNAPDLRQYVPERDLPSELLYADMGCSDDEESQLLGG